MSIMLTSDGAKLYYQVHGDGPTLVLAHGVGGNHASWYQQVPAFSERFRVVTFDHRGFGNSSDPAGAGRGRFVDDLAALLDHLHVDSATLLAQSMGGGTCSGFTLRHPARVRALVLADTLVGLEEPDEIRERMQEVRARTGDLPQLERVLGARLRREQPEAALLYRELASFNRYALKTLPGTLVDTVTAEGLAGTGVPVLFLVGAEDILFPPDAVAAVHRRVPGSALVEIPKAGHSAYFEKPREFNTAVLDFLQGLG